MRFDRIDFAVPLIAFLMVTFGGAFATLTLGYTPFPFWYVPVGGVVFAAFMFVLIFIAKWAEQ